MEEILGTERNIKRQILIFLTHCYVTCTAIREQTKVQDALTMALKLKWKWAGHVARYKDDRWTLLATRWKGPAGKRNPGRPYRRWRDDIEGIAGKDWLLNERKRKEWDKLEEAYTQRGVQQKNAIH